eukprot:COSAG02_NODE_371_length_23642_cov_21.655227_9_plen_437_part_00
MHSSRHPVSRLRLLLGARRRECILAPRRLQTSTYLSALINDLLAMGLKLFVAHVDQDICSSEQVDVFVAGMGEGPAGCFRIPTILTVNETLLVFVERRFLSCGDESPHSIELRRSTDSGRTWLPQQLLDTVGAECKTAACNVAKNGTVSNGAGVVDESTGTLYFAYRKTSVAPAGFWTYMVSSTDIGVTWTPPMNKGLSKTGTSPGQGAGVQLTSGRLVLPNNGGGSIYSDTHGATWKDGSNWAPPGTDGHTDYGETQIAMLSDGKTLLNIGHGNRKQERYQIFSQSTDGGATWGKVYRRPELVNVGCQQSMISHTEGDRHFLYYVAPRGLLLDLSEFDEVTQRRDGAVYCSQDDGQTWWLLEPAVIRPGPFMYSGIVHRATNESHVTLGFIFESYVNETKACEPWCSSSSPGQIGEPAKDLSIAYAQRTYALPKF